MQQIKPRLLIACSFALVSILLFATPVFAESGLAETDPTAVGTDNSQVTIAEPPAENSEPEGENPGEHAFPAEGNEMTPDQTAGEPEQSSAEYEMGGMEESAPGSNEAPSAEPQENEETSVADSTVGQETEPPDTEMLVESLSENNLSLSTTEGETLDLASAETAEAVKAPDPYFKVGTTTYRFFEGAGVCATNYPGDPNCYDSQGSDVIQDAINFIQANGTIPTDRTIYVEGSHTYSGGITLNGSLPNLNSIKGIIGVDGSENTTLTGDVAASDLINGFTLQGFTINGGINASYITGTITLKDLVVNNPSQRGITVDANIDGAVVIEDVKSNGNLGGGALIDNQDNGKAYNVTVKNSSFDHNDDGVFNVFGLEVRTIGKVIMDGVSASHNNGAGVHINSDFSSLTVNNSSMIGNNNDPNHGAYDFGLLASSTQKANISLENVYITDSFDNDAALQLITAGNVTLRNTHVIRSAGIGARIENLLGTGFVKIYDSIFSENAGGTGLTIQSYGTVYLSSVQANDNGTDGVFIDNCQQNGGVCTGNGTVTVTSPKSKGVFGANEFSDNSGFGLFVQSGKNISISNIHADNNSISGIYAINDLGNGSISLKKTIPSTDYLSFTNTANNNITDHGILFSSNGAITVEYLQASENGLAGAVLDNDGGAKSNNITVKYGEFEMNNRQGLAVYSSRNILLTNIIANNNGLSGTYHGAYLYTLNSVSGGVTLSSSKGFISEFNNNTQRGLYIEVVGNVSLKNLESTGNQSGLYIDAINSSTSPRNVTISNGSFINSTAGYGFEIDAQGNINLDNITASDNDLGGGRVGLTYLKYPKAVSVKYSSFDRNNIGGGGYDGLNIRNYGTVTLYAVSASGNDDEGVFIDNCQWDGVECLGSGNVSIKSKSGVYNTFSNNGAHGLFIWSDGSITVSQVYAENNESEGIYINNNWDGSKGNVSISGSSSTPTILAGNSSRGVYITSFGNVSLKYTEAFDNQDGGAYISNNNSPSIRTVSISESSFNRNLGTGLEVYSLGNITLQGVDASDNSVFEGTLIFNDGYIADVLSHKYPVDQWTTNVTSTGAFTLTLNSLFFDAYLEVFGPDGALIYTDDNSGGGTDALINGTFTSTGDHTFRITAIDSGSGYYELNLNGNTGLVQASHRGVYLSNTNETAGVTIKNSPKRKYGLSAWNNSYMGLNIQTYGSINVNSLEVMYNGSTGIYASNDHINEKSASFTSILVEGSAYYGIQINSAGNVTLNKVSSNNNLREGTYITNSISAIPRFVKVSNSEFSGTLESSSEGLLIYSSGAVTLTNVVAENPQGSTGVYIDNTNNENQKVTISGNTNVFSNNGDSGLHILSKGAISLTNVTAEDNDFNGIYLVNSSSATTPSVKINATKGFNNIKRNSNNGLVVFSNGIITLNKVNASENTFTTLLNNAGSFETASISVSNSIFNSNGTTGIDIQAAGKITLNNITGAMNGDTGIYLSNSTVGEGVTIKKSQSYGNTYSGIYITSQGFVDISNTNSFENELAYGVYISNGTDGVSISNGNFSNNFSEGIAIYTSGAVNLKMIDTFGNNQSGIYVSGNAVNSAVNLTSVNAGWNAKDGVSLTNIADITVSLSNFISNGSSVFDGDGLNISGNGGDVVTISKSNFLANYGNGLELFNIGSYTMTSSLALGNDADGDNIASEVDVFLH